MTLAAGNFYFVFFTNTYEDVLYLVSIQRVSSSGSHGNRNSRRCASQPWTAIYNWSQIVLYMSGWKTDTFGQLLKTKIGRIYILESVVFVIKLFGGNLDFPKIRQLNKICSNVCLNLLRSVETMLFLSKNILKNCFSFKMAHSCCFSQGGGNLDFL